MTDCASFGGWPDGLPFLTPEAIAKALEGLPAPQAEALERTLDVPGVGPVLSEYPKGRG
jgi:hypothetical protein